MQCVDCGDYRHDGPCVDLHQVYMDAFEAMMLYQAKHDPSHRTIAQMNELSRLTSICEFAKYRFEKSEGEKWKHGVHG